MKSCPFCAEEIQEEAIKCKHCGEFLNKRANVPWYFKTSSLIVAFVCVGPLALPLAWFNPAYSMKKKIVITVVIGVLSYWLGALLLNSLLSLKEYYKVIFE